MWYAFLIEGRGFRIEKAEAKIRAGRVGFYTWRFIEAQDRDAAATKAEVDVAEVARERFSAQGKLTVRPMTAADGQGAAENSPPSMRERAPGVRGSGFILYPEMPVVADLAHAMDGVASMFRKPRSVSSSASDNPETSDTLRASNAA